MIYLALAILLPFIASTTGDVACSQVQAMAVYGTYCGYVAFSTLGEIGIIAGMRSILKSDSGSGTPSCNRYLHVKWLQGQLASLTTFIHIGFVASTVVCLYTGRDGVDGLAAAADEGLHKLEANVDDAQGKQMAVVKVSTDALIEGLSSTLALIAAPLLLASHCRRVKYIWQFLWPQPEVHRLLPHTHRNSQLAWLCNFQAAACVLDSVSLSDYMLDFGGPVVAGKKKDQPKDKPVVVVEDIKSRLLLDRLKLQDLPMLFILTVHFLVHAIIEAGKPPRGDGLDVVPVVQIGVTCISIMSGYTSYRWQLEAKGVAHVDTRAIVDAIQARQE